MRRIEYSRRLEEASCGVRGELLNRWSGVRIPASAPFFVFNFGPQPCGPRRIAAILPIVWLRPGYTEADPNSGAAVFWTAAPVSMRQWVPAGGMIRRIVSTQGQAL